MTPPSPRPCPSGDSDAHEAKFPRLEETGQAALEVAQEEDAAPQARAEDAQGVSLRTTRPPGFPFRSSLCNRQTGKARRIPPPHPPARALRLTWQTGGLQSR